MDSSKFPKLTRQLLAAALAVLSMSLGTHALAQNGKAKGKVTRDQAYVEKFKRIAPSEQKAAAKRAAKRGLKPGIAGLTAIDMAAVRYPTQGECRTISGPTATGRSARSRRVPSRPSLSWTEALGTPHPTVTIDDAYLPAGASPPLLSRRRLRVASLPASRSSTRGAGYMAPVVTITDPTGTGALADAIIGGPLTGGIRKFVDSLPGLTPAGANNSSAGSTSRLRFPSRALIAVRRRTATRSPWSSTRRRCTRTCQRPSSGATCSCRQRQSWRIPLVNLDGTPVLMPDGVTQARGCGQSTLPRARHRGPGQGSRHCGNEPGGRSRSRFASRSTTCFQPVPPAETSCCRWTRRFPVPGSDPRCRARQATSTRRTGRPSTSTATTPCGSATATPTSGSRRQVKPPPTRRASARGTCRTWARVATPIRRLPGFPATLRPRRAAGA